MNPVTFPVVPRPDVSIVMPTYGGWEWVGRALTAVVENTDPCYEVILVDNASPDGLADRLAVEVRNARLVRNAVNRGFGCAINQGVGYATGAAVVFLNSDAFVHPGWLPPLLDRLERDARTAAVGPRVLNPDGSLQEAGSLLFQNGYTQFYGSGDGPAGAEYRFARRVDYTSAVCLLVRRRDFLEVGGFDAAYAPAYFEDVDLCLALAARGRATVYEPRSTVTHLRGASGDERTAGVHWSRNLPVFEKRWRAVLASRPAFSPDDRDLRSRIAARDVRAPVRLLVSADRFPEPAFAAEPRVLWLLRELTTLYPDSRVTLLLPGDAPSGPLEPLAALGVEVAAPKDLGRWLEARSFHYDVVVLAGSGDDELFDLLETHQPQAYRVVDLGGAGTPPRASRRTTSAGRRRRRIGGFEMAASADVVLASAPTDLGRARAIADGTPSFLLPTPFEGTPDSPGFSERRNLIFLAASDVEGDPEDAEALAALTDHVLPSIRRESPEVELTAIIRTAAKEVSRLERHGVHVVAPDAGTWERLAFARVLVAPFPSRPVRSAFLREAASAGLPFVVTPHAAAGLPFEAVPPDALAADLSELARKTLALDRDERRWVRLRDALLRAFARAGSPEASRRTLSSALALVGCPPPPPTLSTS